MARPLRITAIGGGTGLPVLLHGLRTYARSGRTGASRVDLSSVAAIVSVSDDGGSSGRLMEEFDTLPPGDIRNCLLALTDDDEAFLLKSFLSYRFDPNEGGGLEGHSVGNLLLTALTRLNNDDFYRAIADAARILNLRGQIVLPTLQRNRLVAELSDGTRVRGESRIRIRENPNPIARMYLEPSHGAASIEATDEACEVIGASDVIALGPGSLFTSVIPPLLVPGIRDALAERSKTVPVVYVANLMTEAGETDGFTVGDHVAALKRHAPGLRLSAVIANDKAIAPTYLQQYAVAKVLRGYESVRRSIRNVLDTPRAELPELDALAAHATGLSRRLGLVTAELQGVLDSRIQVVLDAGCDDLKGTELVPVSCAQEVEIQDGAATKRVIRHDAGPVIEALLSVVARAVPPITDA